MEEIDTTVVETTTREKKDHKFAKTMFAGLVGAAVSVGLEAWLNRKKVDASEDVIDTAAEETTETE